MGIPPLSQERVDDSETLSRFLLFSKWFSTVNQRVKADAFVVIGHPKPAT
jgi:hypothetical protein